jgi:modification methylase
VSQPVQLSVWLTGQPHRAQRTGRYVSASIAHPGKMLPAIAAYTTPVTSSWTRYAIGTTLVEAVDADRGWPFRSRLGTLAM